MTIQNNDTQSINIVLIAIQKELEDLKRQIEEIKKELHK